MSRHPRDVDQSFDLHRAFEALDLETPPTETHGFEQLLGRELDSSHFAKELRSNWRSLLDETQKASSSSPSTGTLFYRPKSGLGLDPSGSMGGLTFKPRDTIGEFELIRLLGQGGMGQVWEAFQKGLDRTIALKVIRPDRVNARTRTYFEREARAAGKLHHPNIVTIHAMGEERDVLWIAQELIDGECTLEDFLQHAGQLTPRPRDFERRVALFFLQLAEALAYAHGRGVTHLDLKPQNVLVAPGDRPLLTDFGLAKFSDDVVRDEARRFEGTPRYMSPEQVRGHADASPQASDQFSFGILLHSAIHGTHPFGGGDPSTVVKAICDEPPHRHAPNASPELDAIAQKALRKLPEDRYESLDALRADLERFLDRRAVDAATTSTARHLELFAKRNARLLVTSLVAVLLVAVAGGLWWKVGNVEASNEEILWDVHIERAVRSFDDFLPEEAEGHLEEAQRLRPESPKPDLVRAYFRFAMSLGLRAHEPLADAMSRGFDPTTVQDDDALGLIALSAYHLGRISEAPSTEEGYRRVEASLLKALEADPTVRAPHLGLFVVYRQLGQTDRAIEALENRKRGLTYDDPYLVVLDAMILEQERRYSEAIDKLEALSGRAELSLAQLGNRGLYRVLARLLLRTGRLSEAVDAAQRALEHNKQSNDAQVTLTLAHLASAYDSRRALDERKASLHLAKESHAILAQRSQFTENVLELATLIELERNTLHDEQTDSAQTQFIASFPEHALARQLKAERLFDEAATSWNEGDRAQSFNLAHKGLELARHRLEPFTILGRSYAFGAHGGEIDPALALQWIEEGMQLVESDATPPTGSTTYRLREAQQAPASVHDHYQLWLYVEQDSRDTEAILERLANYEAFKELNPIKSSIQLANLAEIYFACNPRSEDHIRKAIDVMREHPSADPLDLSNWHADERDLLNQYIEALEINLSDF